MQTLVNEKFDPGRVSIIEIKFIKGQIDAPESYSPDTVKEYKIDNTLELAFNITEKLAKSEYKVDIETISSNSNNIEAKGSFHIIFIFRIDNLEELAKLNKDNLVDLDPALGNALVSITYSTARGLLINKVSGTPLEKFILPVIDPNTLIK
jgi:hypothetical protein